MAAPTIMGRTVVLRAPRASDAHDRIRHGRHAEIMRMYGSDAAPSEVTRKEAEAWLTWLEADDHAWVIEYEGRCVGDARLHSLEGHDRRAQYAIGLHDPGLLGQGLGTHVTRLVLAHAFTELRLHRVGLRVLDYNHRAIRCYEKSGFRIEGVERESALIGHEWHNDVIMGVLASDVT